MNDPYMMMLGDCLERMKEFPDGAVNLVVTSPPYDDLRSYNESLDDWNEAKCRSIQAEIVRLLAPGGAVVWVVADATIKGSETGSSMKQAMHFMTLGLNLHDTMIWEKTGSGCMGSPYCYAQNFEFMFVLSKGKLRVANLICDRENVIKEGLVKVNGVNGGIRKDGTYDTKVISRKALGKRTNIWRIQPAQKTGHPAAFPLSLATDHIASWSNIDDVVLDPFMGSGTTGVACVNTGRRFIGIERDPNYFQIARERILGDEAFQFS